MRLPSRPRHALTLRRLAGLALLCCAGAVQAQFVWIAPNGTRQYSDQPPPPGTPPSKILKAPGRAPISTEPAPLPAEPAARPKAPTLAERDADYRKRLAQRDEAERKAHAEAQAAAAQAEYCKAMRNSKRMTDSGIRIAEVGADGRQRFLSDSERAERAAGIDKALAGCR